MSKSRAVVFIAGALTLLGGTTWLAVDHSSKPKDPAPNTLVALSELGPAERVAEPTGVASTTLHAVGALPSSPDSRLGSQLELFRQQLQAQQRHLTQQRAEIDQLRSALQTATESTTNASSDDVSESAEDSAAQEEGRTGEVESQFASEAVDKEWAATAVEEISAAVGKVVDTLDPEAYDGLALQGSACAKTLCRLEFQHRNEHVMRGFIRQLPRHLGWQTDGHIHVINNHDGSVSAVVYLSRDGYSLPTYSN